MIQKINNILKNLRPFAPVVLRIGMAGVFLWFGANQLMDPRSWIGFVPDSVTSATGLSSTALVYLNGAFEIVFGSALLLGFYTRLVAFLLAAHLLDITFTVGLDAIGVRDLGLSIAALAVWLYGSDWLSLDRWMKRGAFREVSQQE